MSRVVLTPKDPLLSFDYKSVLFRQFIKNSIAGMEVAVGEEIELTILGGTAVFQVVAADANTVTPDMEVFIEVAPTALLDK